MSEVHDSEMLYSPRPRYVSQFRFTPDEQLRSDLGSFFADQAHARQLGQRGLFLYSDQVFAPTKRGTYNPAQESGRLSPELSKIGRTLRERGRGHRELAKRLEFVKLPDKAPGMSIRLDVIVDEMTARAMLGTVDLKPDRSIGVHLNIRRHDLVRRSEYLAACHNLYKDLLDDQSRLGIESIDLIDRQV